MDILSLLEKLLDSYVYIIVIIIIVKILYLIVLLCKVTDNANESYKNGRMLTDIYNNQVDEIENQENIKELLIEQNNILERIAQALEQDSEPYIIEDEEET